MMNYFVIFSVTFRKIFCFTNFIDCHSGRNDSLLKEKKT